jgi:hypothetical protein
MNLPFTSAGVSLSKVKIGKAPVDRHINNNSPCFSQLNEEGVVIIYLATNGPSTH